MDIGLALTYVTKDEAWLKKVLIGGVLFLIPLVGALIVYGYGVRIARNVISGVPNPLPEWDDIGGDLSRGFFVFLGGIIWAIPIWVLYFCSFLIGSISDEAGILTVFINLCLIFPISLLFSVFVAPTIVGRFAITNEFSSMIQFSDIIAVIRGIGFGPYLMYLVLSIVAGFIGVLGLIACFIGVLFTLAYAMYAQFHGIGQIARLAPDSYGAAPAQDHPAF
ncbi:hypothetical protein BH23CHL2_BH23CHL2_19150 [soil metagenome]